MRHPTDTQVPIARMEGVLIQQVGEEVVIFDPSTVRYASLNPTAAFVWAECDGVKTVAEIIATFGEKNGLADARDVVWLSLDVLTKEGLLESALEMPEDLPGKAVTRRDALAAAAGLVALPLVTTLVAPMPASAQSAPAGDPGDPGDPTGPQDCVVSAWSAWSACSASCGGGVRTRTRTVVSPAVNGGAPCPTLVQTEPCNDIPCPQDCVMSEWSAWSPCSASCGGGVQTRTRTVLVPAAAGGKPCGATTEGRSCNDVPCPQDCVMGPWSAWGPCVGGSQTRTRAVLVPPSGGGAPCGPTTETRSC